MRELNIGHGKLLLFKGKGPVSAAIRWQTRGKYSHVGVLTPDHTIVESWQGTGVRERDVLDDWEGVDAFDIHPGHNTQEIYWRNVIELMRSQKGKKYDYKAIWRFISRKRKLTIDDRWFCSEIFYWASVGAGRHLLADHVHPSLVSPDMVGISPLKYQVPLFIEEL